MDFVCIRVFIHSTPLKFFQNAKAVPGINLRKKEEVAEKDDVAFVYQMEREVVVSPICARARERKERALPGGNAHDQRKRRLPLLDNDARDIESRRLKSRDCELAEVVIPDRAKR